MWVLYYSAFYYEYDISYEKVYKLKRNGIYISADIIYQIYNVLAEGGIFLKDQIIVVPNKSF